MRLCLSSDALPAGSMADLASASRRRALSGLELRVGAGHKHGVDESLCTLRSQAGIACLSSDHVPVLWLVLPRGLTNIRVLTWAGAAASVGAGLILQDPVASPPSGMPLALLHGTDSAGAARAAAWAGRHGAATCWEFDGASVSGEACSHVLEATRSTLAHVRLLGSGPEAESQETGSAGLLLSRLALSGYSGTLSIGPSAAADPEVWRHWLMEKRGWGCGTAAEKKALRKLSKNPMEEL